MRMKRQENKSSLFRVYRAIDTSWNNFVYMKLRYTETTAACGFVYFLTFQLTRPCQLPRKTRAFWRDIFFRRPLKSKIPFDIFALSFFIVEVMGKLSVASRVFKVSLPFRVIVADRIASPRDSKHLFPAPFVRIKLIIDSKKREREKKKIIFFFSKWLFVVS